VFETFLGTYRISPPEQAQQQMWADPDLLAVRGYRELLAGHAGAIFDDGLYRLHSANSAQLGALLVANAFPETSGRVRPFGYDWMGRQFVVDLDRIGPEGEPMVTMAAVGEGELFHIPADFLGFHNTELVEHPDEALALFLFKEWSAASSDSLPLSPRECVGYRIPLFAGGTEELANLELTDLKVYWALTGQFHQKVKDLPDGTLITGPFTISDP
jgi:hypothetical protein